MAEAPFDLIRSRVVIETRLSIFLMCSQRDRSRRIFFCAGFTTSPWILAGFPHRSFRESAGRRSDSRKSGPLHLRNIRKFWRERRTRSGGVWRVYYSLLWHLGGSQTDIASLRAEAIGWQDRTVSYGRQKTGSNAQIHFGELVEAVLRTLPKEGPLFPMLSKWDEAWRAKAFIRRCKRVGVNGVSLHSYRYAWVYLRLA